MSQYTLIFFDTTGRGELCRMIFAVAGQKYEDKRIQMFTEPDFDKVRTMKKEDIKLTEDWQKHKQEAPFGQLPVLKVDGHEISQSKVIAGFLAKRFDLAGSNEFEAAKAAMIVESTDDAFLQQVVKSWDTTDENSLTEFLTDYATTIFPAAMKNFEKQAGENGHFIGDKLSYADIAFYNNYTMCAPHLKVEANWDEYPKLKAVMDNVKYHPRIAQWLTDRPKNIL